MGFDRVSKKSKVFGHLSFWKCLGFTNSPPLKWLTQLYSESWELSTTSVLNFLQSVVRLGTMGFRNIAPRNRVYRQAQQLRWYLNSCCSGWSWRPPFLLIVPKKFPLRLGLVYTSINIRFRIWLLYHCKVIELYYFIE